MLNLMDDNERIPFFVSDPLTALSIARELFQKGIVHVMNDNNERGIELLTRSKDFITKFPSNQLKYEDWIRAFFIDWLVLEMEYQSYLERALAGITREINENLFSSGVGYIVQLVSGCGIKVNKEVRQAVQSFKPESNDKFEYETVADLILDYCMTLFMSGQYRSVKPKVLTAQKLYAKALEKVDDTINLEKPQWKKYRILTDAELKELEEAEALEYLKIRETVRGNIPLARRQGELMENLAKILSSRQPEILKKFRNKLDDFFNEVINPPNRVDSQLGLMEELKWSFVKRRYYYIIANRAITGSPGNVLRQLLN